MCEVSQLTFEQAQLLPLQGRKSKIERVDKQIKRRKEKKTMGIGWIIHLRFKPWRFQC